MTIENFLSEINKIIDARIERYVSSRLETVYFGIVSSVSDTGSADIDLGFKTVTARNMSGEEVSVGDNVLVKAPWNAFNNAYIDKKI